MSPLVEGQGDPFAFFVWIVFGKNTEPPGVVIRQGDPYVTGQWPIRKMVALDIKCPCDPVFTFTHVIFHFVFAYPTGQRS